MYDLLEAVGSLRHILGGIISTNNSQKIMISPTTQLLLSAFKLQTYAFALMVTFVTCTIASANELEQAAATGSKLQNNETASNARFLMQASIGFNRDELEYLHTVGPELWIEQQLTKPSTKLEPYIEYLASRNELDWNTPSNQVPYHKVKSNGNNVGYLNLSTAWVRSALNGEDLLRQRTAWALSQILVVSNRTNILTEGAANYYDMLLVNAFDRYETLLLNATYHPIMGKYLTYMGSSVADSSKNIVPDENYAREIMQLFSIGLWQLKDNGERKLDSNGSPIPTYTNDDIRAIARVFTGFWLSNSRFGKIDWSKFDESMVIHRKHHDRYEKNALNGYIKLPAGVTPDAEVKALIRALANHPNTAPFITRKLIQNLVTSNPSPEYIKRVVNVWRKTDGNLGQVISAILLDSDARRLSNQSLYQAKLKEPIVRVVSLIKGLDCGSDLGTEPNSFPGLQWWHPYLDDEINQRPLGAGSVFNFFDQDYATPGLIEKNNLVSPEFKLIDAVSSAKFTNYIWRSLNNGFHTHPSNPQFSPLDCELDWEQQLLSTDTRTLIDYLNVMFTAGTLSDQTEQLILDHLQTVDNPDGKVRAAILGVALSPEGAILK